MRLFLSEVYSEINYNGILMQIQLIYINNPASFRYVNFHQIQLAEALLWTPSGSVAGLSAQRWFQLYPGGLCHPGGAFPVFGAAHRHQTPTM